MSNSIGGAARAPIRSRYEDGISILVYSKREFPVLSGCGGYETHMCQFLSGRAARRI